MNVLRGDDLLASLTCRPGPETQIAPIFALSDAMTDAGWRRDLDAGVWRPTDQAPAD